MPSVLAVVLTVSIVTIILRVGPFLVYRSPDSIPPVLTYLGTVLPSALMGMLVVYALKGADVWHAPYALPEILAILAIVVVYRLTHNGLVTIIGGTVLYMVLVQTIGVV